MVIGGNHNISTGNQIPSLKYQKIKQELNLSETRSPSHVRRHVRFLAQDQVLLGNTLSCATIICSRSANLHFTEMLFVDRVYREDAYDKLFAESIDAFSCVMGTRYG